MDIEEPRVIQTLYLAAELNAAALSRALVRLVLRQWGLPELIDDAIAVVSELTANAVEATMAYQPRHVVNQVKLPALIRVQVVLYEEHVYIGIWDRSREEPELKEPSTIDEGGRGLFLVSVLSERWGWETVHPHGPMKGKVVWAELRLPHPPVNPNGLPQRMPGQQAHIRQFPHDRPVLERVRCGLDRL